MAVYADYAINTEADSEDTAYQFGTTLGKAKKPGSWALDYNYRVLEKDAVFGTFTDSDFNGGGTDGEGHRVQAKYQLAKNWQLSGTAIASEPNSAAGADYTRYQLDLKAKF